jgi:hypothetical protein
VEELNIDRGTKDMCCDCSKRACRTCHYQRLGDAKLRSLIEKGPLFREQNCITGVLTRACVRRK